MTLSASIVTTSSLCSINNIVRRCLQYLGGRGLLVTRFGKFSLTLGKLTFEIGYTLLGIG